MRDIASIMKANDKTNLVLSLESEDRAHKLKRTKAEPEVNVED